MIYWVIETIWDAMSAKAGVPKKKVESEINSSSSAEDVKSPATKSKREKME
jgi:hypothetical protein